MEFKVFSEKIYDVENKNTSIVIKTDKCYFEIVRSCKVMKNGMILSTYNETVRLHEKNMGLDDIINKIYKYIQENKLNIQTIF